MVVTMMDTTGSFANISATTNTFGSNSAIQHVIIIIMENKGYFQIIGSSNAPYQNDLAKNMLLLQNITGEQQQSSEHDKSTSNGDTASSGESQPNS